MKTVKKTLEQTEEIFQRFKKVFGEGISFENVECFLNYCETHSQTQRALFSAPQILLLQMLRGEISSDDSDIIELKKKYENGEFIKFTSVFFEQMDEYLQDIKNGR